MSQAGKLSLFVFVDAFGWKILQKHSFLEDVLPIKTPLKTVLGYSSTCIPTILTGKLPQEHGHMSFFYYDPDRSPFKPCRPLRFLPDNIAGRGRVRRLLSKAIQKFYGYTGYFQLYNMPFEFLHLFNYSEKLDIYQPGGINGGVPTIFDFLRGRGIPFHLSDWRATEENNISSLLSSVAGGGIRFAYLYLPAMDGLMHSHGTDSPLVSQKIQWYESQIRQVFNLARRHYGSVTLHVFSDHGMTDITSQCDLMARIRGLDLRFGLDYAAVFDSTMARFWFLRRSAREQIVEVLGEEPSGRILSQRELLNNGCYFPDDQYGDLFFLMNPGVLICPSHMGEKPMAGMHGYEPGHEDSVAMFSSNVAPTKMPTRLDDMYSLMTREAVEPA